jgi:electron transfer flavoprotein beta subunit
VLKIIVPVKQVAVLDDDFELDDDGRRVDPDCVERALNEWDEFSVEAALQLREQEGEDAAEVIVVTVGDDEAEDALLACLAKGADRAVRIWDETLEAADALAVARVLASWAHAESPDLVLCGVQSSDAVNGATGVALAAHLGLRHVAVVSALEVDADARSARLTRELEGGLLEDLAVGLPALLTVQTGINEPRYATLRQIKLAREKPLATLGLADVGLDADAVAAAAGARVRALQTPERGPGAQRLEGSVAEVAGRIMEIAKERMQG